MYAFSYLSLTRTCNKSPYLFAHQSHDRPGLYVLIHATEVILHNQYRDSEYPF